MTCTPVDPLPQSGFGKSLLKGGLEWIWGARAYYLLGGELMSPTWREILCIFYVNDYRNGHRNDLNFA
jgi:hypothetical protein